MESKQADSLLFCNQSSLYFTLVCNTRPCNEWIDKLKSTEQHGLETQFAQATAAPDEEKIYLEYIYQTLLSTDHA